MPGPREALAENGSVFLDLVNFGDFPSILVARPPKKPFWHPTEAVPIPHTTTRALPPPTPTAAVHTRTGRGRPRAAGAERCLGMLPSVSQAFLPSQAPNFDQIPPKRGPKSPHEKRIRCAISTAAPTACTFAVRSAADGCWAAGPGAGALPPDRVPCIV